MRLSLNLYLADSAEVRGTIGSRNEKLRRTIGGQSTDDMARADLEFNYKLLLGAPTRDKALRAVINGGPFEAKHGFQYGYAYEMVCGFLGKRLNNHLFHRFRADWLEQVDAGLAELGITAVKVGCFVHPPPPPLPRPADLPGYGEWSAKACEDGLAQWKATTAAQRAALDPRVGRAAERCGEWLRASSGTGRAVVGFRY